MYAIVKPNRIYHSNLKMKDLNDFIKKLTNIELAIFIFYRFKGFLSDSKEKIKDEVSKRNLSKEDLQKLFDKGIAKKSDRLNCPRCNSDKLFTEQDIEYVARRYSKGKVLVETTRCRLCGYNPGKSNKQTLFQKLFGLYKVKGERYEEDGLFEF